LVTGALVLLSLGAPAAQQGDQPIFRAGTDLIELDVSVLDSNGRAVTGLAPSDFVVTEDGTPQKVTAVSFIDIATHDPARSARMRFVERDVATNDLGDLLGNGRLLAIVLDDANLPADDPEIVRSAREAARYVIDQLGPSDMAAVLHAHHSGRTQDFTSDRGRLLASIDAFVPATIDDAFTAPAGAGSGSDMVQRWSPALMRSPCLRNEPAVPSLDAATTRMATAPGRRKALIFLSVGVPVTLGAGSSCGSHITDVMRNVFRKAQAANVNVYAIDPAGLNGYVEYLRRHPQPTRGSRAGARPRASNIRQLQDFMRVLASTTGGRAVINTDAIETAIDRIFAEDRSYYLVGYESSNGAPDGRFREVSVRVNRPQVTIRTRSGYWAPRAEDVAEPSLKAARVLSMAGLFGPQGLPLRAAAAPIGLVEGGLAGSREFKVASVLTVRWPAGIVHTDASDTLTVIRHIYDHTGNPGPPVREVVTVPLPSGRQDDIRHDLIQAFALPPGRYEVRFHVQSALAGVNGSVYADLDVPDVRRASLSIAGPILGPSEGAGASHGDALTGVLPIEPTSQRDFSVSDRVSLFARIYQGGAGPLLPVTVTTEVVDARDEVQSSSSVVMEPGAFDEGRSLAHHVEVPVRGLRPGPYLVGLAVRLPSGFTSRKDILIRIR
jgi:VWFA-related protein